MFYFSHSSKVKLSSCDEKLQKIASTAIVDSPYDFGISQGHRTPEYQNELYQQGRTKPGEIITNCDGYKIKSKHNEFPSHAFDIAIFVDGLLTWNKNYYKAVGNHICEIAKKFDIRIKWPINIGTIEKPVYDWPHFELI